jgi:hypothetical protein
MGTRFRAIRLVPWGLTLAVLSVVILALPGGPSSWENRSPVAADREAASAPFGPSTIAADPAPSPPDAQPVASGKERPAGGDAQRRLLTYLILRSATGRYPFALLR